MTFEELPAKFKKVRVRLEHDPDSSGKVPVKRVSPGGVPVRDRPQQPQVRRIYSHPQASVGRVYPDGVAVKSKSRQSQTRGIASVSSGVAARPPQQPRRTVPVRMVVVKKPSPVPAGQAVQDSVLGLPPVKSAPVSRSRSLRDKLDSVRDMFEDVLDKFGGVGEKFEDFRDRFEGLTGVTGFLMAHWWAILVVLAVIGILTFSGFVGISGLKTECEFSISVDCLDHSVKKDSVELLIKNVAERNVIIKNIKVTSDVLEGPSGSDSGTCELALGQRGHKLKKNAKSSFNLNVRPVSGLSVEGSQGFGSGWNLLGEDVILVRAQDVCSEWEAAKREAEVAKNAASGIIPDISYATLEVTHAAGNATEPVLYNPTASSVHDKASRTARELRSTSEFNEVVIHYAVLVADAATRNNPQSASAAYENVRDTRYPLLDELSHAFSSVVTGVNNAGNSRTISATLIRNDAQPSRNEFPSGDAGDVSFHYARKVVDSTPGHDIVEGSRSYADESIAYVTAHLNEITAAARDEANRASNPESIKQAVRDNAERYKNRDSYFAADFVAKEVEKADTIQQIRSRVNNAYNTHFRGYVSINNRGGSLSKYRFIIFEYSGNPATRRYPYYLPRGPSTSYSEYFEKFNVTDFEDNFYPNPSLGPVVNHYHALARDRVILPYTRELENLENSAFYRGLDSSKKTALSRAFNDPYYDGQPTTQYYGLPITSPLDDPKLSTRNDSKHLQANDIIKDELHDRFDSMVDDLVTDASNTAYDVHYVTIGMLDNPVNAESVKNSAKEEAWHFRATDSRHANQFVIQRIESITASDKDVTFSEIEAAVSDAIDAVTDGANFGVQKIQDAYDARTPSVQSVKMAAQTGAESSSGTRSYRAVVFVAGIADVNADSSSDVVSNVGRDVESLRSAISSATQRVVKVAEREANSVVYIEREVAYVKARADEVVDRLRQQNHPGADAAEIVADSIRGPGNAGDAVNKAITKRRELIRKATEKETAARNRFNTFNSCFSQCRVGLGISCSDNVDCCSGVCEGGVCIDAAVLCGSQNLGCCYGTWCDEGLACQGAVCVGADVDCGSSEEACCPGSTCDSGLECVSGRCEVSVVCGSEGDECCSGSSCDSGLECVSGMCKASVVCGSEGEECCSGNYCDSGLECVGGMCEAPVVCDSVGDSCCGDGSCGSGLVCKSGTCETPCGAEHQQCCTGGDPCTGDLVCAGSGTASTCQQCGSGGQVCCGNRVCDENFECTGTGTGMCMGDCGSEGQKCCTGGSECGLNLACAGSGEDKTCQLCGEKDLACCTAGDQCRESNLECDAGICVEAEECGSESQACCAADTCGSGLECESGICREVECGSEGQVCCAASTCASGFECRRGTCRGAEECGSEGLMCCRGDKCDLDLECVNNRCEMPDVSDEIDSAFQTFSFDIITPGSNTSLVVNESGIPFSLIQFAVSEAVNDVELNVTSWSEPPPGVSGGPVGVQPYSYVTIASGDLRNEDVSPVVVEFSVAKDFFSEGVSPDYVRLFEYNKVSHAWNKLDDPAYLSEDEDSHYFKVVADGLVGDFAIGLEKFVSCAHRDIAEGKNRYTIELIYSWESSPAVNHKVAGELLANSPE